MRIHANKQIQAAEVTAQLGTMVPERQARELAPLRDDPDRMREVWNEANEATGGKPIVGASHGTVVSDTKVVSSDHLTSDPEPDYATADESDLIVNHDTGEILDAPHDVILVTEGLPYLFPPA